MSVDYTICIYNRFREMNFMRRSIIALLTLCCFVVGMITVPNSSYVKALDVQATDENQEAGTPDGWFFVDAMNDVFVTGDSALGYMGDEISDLLLSIEEQNRSGISPKGRATIPQDAPDMSVYDVLNFKDKDTYDTEGGYAVLSSVYEFGQYAMYRIMSGTGWVATQDNMQGIYSVSFKPDENVHESKMPIIISEVVYFIYAYFPHYFYFTGAYSTKEVDGVSYIDTVDLLILHTVSGNSMNWVEEYEEAERITATSGVDLSGVFQKISASDGRTLIYDADKNKRLKNAHDYIAARVAYGSDSHLGQRAYCALLEDKTVCNGYGLAYSMLCLRMGLDVPYMTGYAGELHAWNLNLTNYPEKRLIDVTWDDQPKIPGGIIYNYYDKPLSDFRKLRTWSKYYESYIDFVHGKKDGLNTDMLFSNMSTNDTLMPSYSIIIPSDVAYVTIDLTAEKLSLDAFNVAAYSLDGGMKWKNGTISNNVLASLFNKGGILKLSNTALARGEKSPAATSTVATFPKIEKRPAATKYVVNYAIAADPTGVTPGQWVLVERGGSTAVRDGFELAVTIDKKTPASGTWNTFPASGGVTVDTESTKTIYLVRNAPEFNGFTYTPASKPIKISILPQQKAPSFKVDYKKEIIKAKKGSVVYFGSEIRASAAELSDVNKLTQNGNVFVKVTDTIAKAGVSVSDYLASGSTSMQIIITWLEATAKKPATRPQVILLANRSVIEDTAASPVEFKSGKAKLSDRKYEAFSNGRWGALPSGATEVVLRLKSTAKAEKNNIDSGYAASQPRNAKIDATTSTFQWGDV